MPFQDSGEGAARHWSRRAASSAYTVLTVPNDFQKAADWGVDVRDAVKRSPPPEGLNVYVTGNLGLFADFTEAFGDLDTKLLLATVVLVITLLLVIYRSVVMPLIPIFVVGVSYSIALGFVYLYAESGETVTGNVTGILPILMFGVGTDYCLLLVSRYREELHRYEDKHDAMENALLRSGPAIIASGATVILSMLVPAAGRGRRRQGARPVVGDRRSHGPAGGRDAPAGDPDDLRARARSGPASGWSPTTPTTSTRSRAASGGASATAC